MAIYHFEGKIISRSQGRSSVGAAAYRAAEKLRDGRTDLIHNFTKKEADIIHKEIILPKDAPEFMKDREKLWNYVEQIENRKDAQLCREFNIALPKELTYAENTKLALEFVKKQFADKGMVADLCLHRGCSEDGEEQPHMHVMVSLRELTKEGFGKKVRAWNDKLLLVSWREKWAETANKYLCLAGYDIRIDHRSYEQQGINLEPQTKIGPKAAREYFARFEEHKQIARENGELIYNNPEIALDALTRQQSTFTHHDLARFINRYTDDSKQFTLVYEKVKLSQAIVPLGLDEQGRERFTTKEQLKLETQMLNIAQEKAINGTHTVGIGSRIDALQERKLSKEQSLAFNHILDNKDLSCIVGFAGTGKSYMLGAAQDAWEKQGFNVIGMTLSGIAAENLEATAGIKSHTIANRLINWENGREKLTKRDIVVVDEAGMLGSRQMSSILCEASKGHAKVVLVGDTEQLQAIEAGAAFRAICENVGYIEMNDIRRQKELWQQDATKCLATNNTKEAISLYDEHNNVHVYKTKDEAIRTMVEQWDEVKTNNPDKSLIMLAYTRDEVKNINSMVRDIMKESGYLRTDYELETSRGIKSFAEGDKIYFLRNDYNLKVKNGTLGTIEQIINDKLSVKLEDKREVNFNLKNYNYIDHGYAATMHKAQGITVDRSFILASKYLDRHATYVALSRHRDGADIFYSRDEFPSLDRLSHQLSSERLKDITLDYLGTKDIKIPVNEGQESIGDQFHKKFFETKEQEAIAKAYIADSFNQAREERAQQDKANHIDYGSLSQSKENVNENDTSLDSEKKTEKEQEKDLEQSKVITKEKEMDDFEIDF